jgi:RNase H-like domain found in reverse transcriptase
LSPAETRYSATDREHLGLVFAARKFRLILHREGVDTRVWSDHSALLTRRKEELTPRQSRWNEIVTHWIPGLRHVKGKENPADFVSRWRVNSVGAEIRA